MYPDYINESFFQKFLAHVESNLLKSIRESIILLDLGADVRISITKTGNSPIYYASNDKREICDEIIVEVIFLKSEDDEGFIITFDLFYYQGNVEIESDVFKGVSGDATIQKPVINSHRISVEYDNLENIKLRLDDYSEVALLLLKEHLYERGASADI